MYLIHEQALLLSYHPHSAISCQVLCWSVKKRAIKGSWTEISLVWWDWIYFRNLINALSLEVIYMVGFVSGSSRPIFIDPLWLLSVWVPKHSVLKWHFKSKSVLEGQNLLLWDMASPYRLHYLFIYIVSYCYYERFIVCWHSGALQPLIREALYQKMIYYANLQVAARTHAHTLPFDLNIILF